MCIYINQELLHSGNNFFSRALQSNTTICYSYLHQATSERAHTCPGSQSDLELVLFDDATRLQVLADLVEDRQHGDVGLPRAGGSADEKVLVGVVGRLKHNGLDPVESLHAFEHQLADLRSKESKKKRK